MSSPNPNAARQYFIGIADNQIGPLTEEEVIRRIKTGSVNLETLVWFEGMQQWALISTIPVFDAAFKGKAQAPKKERIEPKKVVDAVKPRKPKVVDDDHQRFLGDEKSVSIVFNEDEGRLGDSSFASDRIVKTLFGLAGLSLLVIGGFYFMAVSNRTETEKSRSKPGVKSNDNRQIQLGKATSELLIDPKTSEETLISLVRANGIDAVAQDAVKVLSEYYIRNQRFADAGRLMLQLKKYPEAAGFFSRLADTRIEAESAYFMAYENSREPSDRKHYLEQSIKGLLATSGPTEKAVERIRLFEKEFPSQPHPFGYYLKAVDDRISDIFSRISFHFVQGLLGYVEAEFPQMGLIDRPLVEVRKDKDGRYKIAGSYRGEILLNKDRLQNIQFVFWLNGDRWVLVDTNLTRERKRWAEQERKKLKTIGISGEQMLKILESAFKNKFPNAAFHERDLTAETKDVTKISDF